MRELVVLSGKGGTGKTSICGSLAVLAANKVLADCDVDAANLHLLLDPEIKSSSPFYGLPKAGIDDEKCLACDLCTHLCRFNAIRNQRVLTENCEGCGVCYHACPCEAIEMIPHVAGELHLSETRYGPLVHANLGVAEDNSGKLVAAVRKKARQVAETEKRELIITDGPPGVGCPVISCLSGIDLVLVVTEPSLSGIHDMIRVLDLADFFGTKAVVCINKWDLHPENTKNIAAVCRKRNVPVPVRLPYDEMVTEAVCQALPVVQYGSGPVVDGIVTLWNELQTMLG